MDAQIDQYVGDSNEGWIRWMRSQVKRADRVLLVFTYTKTYQRRFEGNEEEGRGLGATFEGYLLPKRSTKAEAAMQSSGPSCLIRRFSTGFSNQALLARMAFARTSKGVASSGPPTVRNKDA